MSEKCTQCGSRNTTALVGPYAHYAGVVVLASFTLTAFTLLSVSGYKALFFAAVILITGHIVRKHYVAKDRSYQCNQCQATFTPGSTPQQNPSAPPQTPQF